MITFKRPDGKDCSAFYAEPAAGQKAPGLVVIQEWWGLNEQIKGVANRLAAAGYRALAPDLYRGQVGLDAKEAEHLMSEHQVRRLPVVENDRLVGIVSIGDLAVKEGKDSRWGDTLQNISEGVKEKI